MTLNSLSNELLVKAYVTAQERNLDTDFISLLKKEIDQRGIDLEKKVKGSNIFLVN